MLPRHLRPGVRRIQRDGDPASATVTAATPRRGGVSLTLDVALPGGVVTTVTRDVASEDLPAGIPAPGDRVPVRYDRHRPQRVELDVAALRARTDR